MENRTVDLMNRIKGKLQQSAIFSFSFVILNTIIVYIIFFNILQYSTNCNQSGTGHVDFDQLSNCIFLIVRFTLLYLLFVLISLCFFFFKNHINKKGAFYSMLFFGLIIFLILISENNIF